MVAGSSTAGPHCTTVWAWFGGTTLTETAYLADVGYTQRNHYVNLYLLNGAHNDPADY